MIHCQGPGDDCYCGATGCQSPGMAITPQTAIRYYRAQPAVPFIADHPWADYWPELSHLHLQIVRAVRRARRKREGGIGTRNWCRR